MTKRDVLRALENVEDGEKFEVKLKNGDRLMCKTDHNRNDVIIAEAQVGSAESFSRGDIIEPREIKDF